MLYIKYGLIALGVIVAIIIFVAAYKTLGPPTFRNFPPPTDQEGVIMDVKWIVALVIIAELGGASEK